MRCFPIVQSVNTRTQIAATKTNHTNARKVDTFANLVKAFALSISRLDYSIKAFEINELAEKQNTDSSCLFILCDDQKKKVATPYTHNNKAAPKNMHAEATNLCCDVKI